jgi:hypothetical protein
MSKLAILSIKNNVASVMKDSVPVKAVKHIFRVGEIVFILAITVAYPCATSSLLL